MNKIVQKVKEFIVREKESWTWFRQELRRIDALLKGGEDR